MWCRVLWQHCRWVQRLQLARALLHTALEASSGPDGGATALLALSTSGRSVSIAGLHHEPCIYHMQTSSSRLYNAAVRL